jgi:tRNA(Ile)-lysidine synthase
MARSHPPTLIRLATRALVEECAIERGERILVAVSGGGDSSALLHVLSVVAPRLGVTLVAHGVDHGLRPEATRELDLAEDLSRRLDVRFGRTRVQVRPGGNLQARAREQRRAALESAADSASATRIATAHHADDRAETVILRLLAGAHPAALGVLPSADGRFVRPLIRARKADVVAHLERHGLAFAEDPSNLDRRFLRVRVRRDVLPLLEELSPAIVSHLTAISDDLLLGPVPEVRDASGRPVALRRAQQQALRRALRIGHGARIRLSAATELVVDRRSGALSLSPAGSRKIRAHGPRGQKGGANSGKSG